MLTCQLNLDLVNKSSGSVSSFHLSLRLLFQQLYTRYSSYTQPKLLSKSGSCFSDKCFLLTTRAAQQMSIYVTISHLVMLVICLLLLLMQQRSLTELHLCRCVLRLWEKWGRMHLCFQTKEKQRSEFTFPSSSLPLQSIPFPMGGERIRICSYSLNVCCSH